MPTSVRPAHSVSRLPPQTCSAGACSDIDFDDIDNPAWIASLALWYGRLRLRLRLRRPRAMAISPAGPAGLAQPPCNHPHAAAAPTPLR